MLLHACSIYMLSLETVAKHQHASTNAGKLFDVVLAP